MQRFYSFTGVDKNRVNNILKFSFSLSLMATAIVYASIRLIFYEIMNPFFEEVTILLKTALMGTLIAVTISALLIGIECADKLMKRSVKIQAIRKPLRIASLVVILCSVFVVAAKAQTTKGVKKDPTTGLTASYQQLVPEKVLLVMNNEVLNHNDIPIGETFILVNKNTTGFVEKNGKVSVGCALIITDKRGKKILDIADLFKGKDIFPKKEMNYLKCTINTGEPMEWEEKYLVQVTFWDKYGTGKVVNKVMIRMIDIP